MFRAVLLLLLASVHVFGDDHVLAPVNDFWRYRAVSTNSPEPGPTWKSLDFDDSTWREGRGGFSTTGGGLLGWPEATFLPYEGASAYTFRKKFVIRNLESIQSLSLRIDHEHGFVAYLNANPVASRGFGTMGSSSNGIPLSAPAQYHPRGNFETIDLTPSLASLSAGTNVLAIQVHSAGVEDPDIVLSAELTANFTRGPFVQNASTNSIQVIWRTMDQTTGFVVYGENPNHMLSEFSTTPGTTHAVTLTNLQPGTAYSYRVFSERDGAVVATDQATFRTLKTRGQAIKFQVFGDTGQASQGQYSIARQMNQIPTDLVLHTGDIVYPYFAEQWADARCFSIYRDQMRHVPFFFSMGNHDGILNLTDYETAFYLPTNSMTGTEQYYSFDHGDAHFVAVAADTQAGQRYTPGSPQYQWLEADLAASTQPWKFIFFHHVIRSSSLHSNDDYLFDGILDKYALQMYIGGLAERYGAQVIFNGHDHAFERFASFNGVNSYITGGGGASLYGQGELSDPGSMQFFMRHHFLNVSVDGPRMTVEAIADNGDVLERFYRSQTSTESAASTWGSPLIEAAGGDPTGNIAGQRFPFSDAGYDTRAGLWGNLGRMHFRNDRSYIYIGFEQAALHTNQVIAMFLENPAAPGVTEIGTLGNNLMDGEVDGLDLLQKLAFTNFQPSIGCLLGDEMADANLRNFKRPGMRWATGQGVFKLDGGFTGVPGIRLQQFNRSPQVAPQNPESNADYIELAIPRSALGNPTNTLRVGAIIFSDPAPAAMEPAIDTALAGKNLTAPGAGRFLLEPMTVTLAQDPNPTADAFAFRGVWISPTQIRFTWNSVPGGVYWIQTSPDLTQSFQDWPDAAFPHTAAGATCTIDMDVAAVPVPQFFRLRTN